MRIHDPKNTINYHKKSYLILFREYEHLHHVDVSMSWCGRTIALHAFTYYVLGEVKVQGVWDAAYQSLVALEGR
jgi:hypothetical protein